MHSERRSWLERALAVSALASYLWLCLAWFDHDLRLGLAAFSPLIPVSLGVASLGALAVLRVRSGILASQEVRLAALLFVLTFVTRLPFVLQAYGLFSSDAAAQGVMTLHILEGRHHPIFLYNWSYVGSLKAHLAALISLLAGDPVIGFALSAALVYAALAPALYLLSRSVLPRMESMGAALYIVFAPGFLTAWGMGNEGNYPDVLMLGTLLLALAARFLKGEIGGMRGAFWMGVLGGLAFWTHILATYYLLAAGLVLIVHRFGKATPARLLSFGLGFAVGDFPGLLWNVSHDFLSFRWWSLDASTAVEETSRLDRTFSQLGAVVTSSFPVLAGFWPQENPPAPEAFFRIFLLTVIPVSTAVFAWRSRERLTALLRGRITPEAMLLGFAVLVVLVFAQSSFGWMTEQPRYLLFLFSVVPVFLASTISGLARRSVAAALLLATGLVFVSLRGALLYYAAARDSDTVNRRFLQELEELGVRHVHSDYHLSYKYVFLSHGRMIWTSALGPSQTEWYPGFREAVEAADQVALVPRSFRFARRIEKRLQERGIRYRRENLLYPVLFEFSERIRPEDVLRGPSRGP